MPVRFSALLCRILVTFCAAIVFVAASPIARATNYYWDTNGATAGAGSSPTGTWSSGGTTWNTDPTGSTATSSYMTQNTDDLYFVAGPTSTSGNAGYTVSVSGLQVADSLNFQASGSTTISGGTLITLGDGGAGDGGINIPQFSFGSTSNGAVFLSTALTLNNSQSWTNNSASLFTDSGTINYSNQLTLTGTGSFLFSGSTAGAGTGGLVLNGSGTLLQVSNVNALGAAGNTLTLTSGTLSSNGTGALAIANSPLVINGAVTLGNVVNTGSLTFSNASQTISSPATITSMSGVTFGTGFTWNANAITYKGPGAVTQQSTVVAATNTGAITIGDNSASGSLAGNVSVNSLTAMGSGAYTINYGGSLVVSAALTPTNTITINDGGFLTTVNNSGTSTFGSAAGTLTVNSGATLFNNTNGSSASYKVNGNTFPTAGALFFNSNNGAINLNDVAYPTLTGGTMVLATLNPNPNGKPIPFLTLATGANPQTIAINASAYDIDVTNLTVGGGGLTLAGVGGQLYNSSSPYVFVGVGTNSLASAKFENAPTGAGGITVSASPTSAFFFNHNYTGGPVTLNSGMVAGSSLVLGSSLTLNGGGIMNYQGGADTIASQAISVGANGGTFYWYGRKNTSPQGTVSSALSNAAGVTTPAAISLISTGRTHFSLRILAAFRGKHCSSRPAVAYGAGFPSRCVLV